MLVRAVGLILTTAALAACGSSTATNGSTRTTSTSATVGAAALNAYTVRGDEEPGFVATAPVSHPTPSSFVAGESSAAEEEADIVRLRQEGFRGALVEHLDPASGSSGGGVSTIILLRSPAAARAELTDEIREAESDQASGGTISQFSAPTVPGSTGFTATQAQQGGAGNLLFVEGSCLLAVGDSSAQSDLTGPLIHAAESIYGRTRGACP